MIARPDYFESLTVSGRRINILFYAILVMFAFGFCTTMMLNALDANDSLPKIDVDKSVYIYGTALFAATVGCVGVIAYSAFVGYLTKVLTGMWLPGGLPRASHYLSILVVCALEYVLLSACLLTLSFGLALYGVIGKWFFEFNFAVVGVGYIVYMVGMFHNLLGITKLQAFMGYTIATSLVVAMGFMMAATR